MGGVHRENQGHVRLATLWTEWPKDIRQSGDNPTREGEREECGEAGKKVSASRRQGAPVVERDDGLEAGKG